MRGIRGGLGLIEDTLFMKHESCKLVPIKFKVG